MNQREPSPLDPRGQREPSPLAPGSQREPSPLAPHYSAFISYRHAPADIAVASAVQKRLEHFHIPAAIRNKTGKKKIGRIFRDKEELSITSDLNEEIESALQSAEYLIVICSTSTRESVWVTREIDFFLKNHSRKQILTVLVDGEPFDVIPEILLRERVNETAPDGRIFQKTVEYEPLSCDFRQGIRTASRSEIPRLASALIGCSYDELVMRERQYRVKRAAAAGITAAVLMSVAIGYLLWSRAKIQENYQRAEDNYQLAEANYKEAQENLNAALMNQSDYLSSESGSLLEEGDRLRAIALAMEALPQEGRERPLSARAEKALSESLNAYAAPGTMEYWESVSTIAEFQTKGNVEDFFATPDGKYLFARDSFENVYGWDMNSRTQIFSCSYSEDGNIEKMIMPFTDVLLIHTFDRLVTYEYMSGEKIWEIEDPNIEWYYSAICCSAVGSKLYLAVRTGGNEYRAVVLDSATGEVLASSAPIPVDNDYSSVTQIVPSPDGDAFAFSIGTSFLSGEEGGMERVFIFRENDSSLTELTAAQFGQIDSIAWPQSGQLVIMGMHENPGLVYGGNSFYNGAYIVMMDLDVAVQAFDPEANTSKWEVSYTTPQVGMLSDGEGLQWNFMNNRELLIASAMANKAVIIRASDGVVLDTLECTGSIVKVRAFSKGVFYFMLENGRIAQYDPQQQGRLAELRYFQYDNDGMDLINTFEDRAQILVRSHENAIWLCDGVYDDGFVKFDLPAVKSGGSFGERYRAGDYLLLFNDNL
ncbi:MAG: toll/interleukin-1 receptor domain-containing protein, partial [Lachnospiraceae bacterium]|nr:toll/interleukin-1 receptor domain-containing protein [Lachnospiraceae bacterium]